MKMKNHKRDKSKQLQQVFVDGKQLADIKRYCKDSGLLIQNYLGDLIILGWNTPVLEGVDNV